MADKSSCADIFDQRSGPFRSTGTALSRSVAAFWTRPAVGWDKALLDAWKDSGNDNIDLIAAGVAFYVFLAIVPLMGAITLIYGLIATPEGVVASMRSLTSVMPTEAAKLIGDQLLVIVTSSGSKKGLGVCLSLGLSLYGAMSAASTTVIALNVAFEERERRGFFRLKLLSLAITTAGIFITLVVAICIATVGHLTALLPNVPKPILILGSLATYAVVGLAGTATAATLYRFGPHRKEYHWVLMTPGSVLTAVAWLAVTLGFGIYVANFGKYDATYGSLGAVVVLLMWLYLSAYALLLGAELDFALNPLSSIRGEQPVSLGTNGPSIEIASSATHDIGANAEAPALHTKTPGFTKRVIVSRVGARAGRAAGFSRLGILPSLLSTGGLMLLRRRGTGKIGLAVLISAGGLSWLGRDKAPTVTVKARIPPTKIPW
ncbi:MAG: YihY/virulence factor BrkB family protein [Sphingomonas sp.]